MSAGAKTIGACIIVRNEARVIVRCLESLRPLVDYVLIEDTGSTDNTQTIISDWLVGVGLPGRVYDEPWQSFAYNRSHALAELRKVENIDYALIIDADDLIVIEEGFDPTSFKVEMQADFYDVLITHGNVRFSRPQLCSNRLAFYFRSVLHEFLEVPYAGCTRATARGFHIETGQGGARSRNPHKYEQDAAVLEQALLTETDPFLISRYTFYLAQSYRDAAQPEKALKAYLARAELGYWNEEIFESLHNAGKLKESASCSDLDIIGTYLKAYEHAPQRIESLHALVSYCRRNGKPHVGYLIGKQAVAKAQPTGGLFVQGWIYDYGMLDELSISAYWAGHYRESLELCERLLAEGNIPPDQRARVEMNADFARGKLNAGARDSAPEAGLENQLEECKAKYSQIQGASAGPVLHGSRPQENDAALPEPSALAQAIALSKNQFVLLVHPDITRFLSSVTNMLCDGFKEMLIEPIVLNSLPPGFAGRALILGANLYAAASLENLAENSIIFNVENSSSQFFTPEYVELIRRFRVWDFCEGNARYLERAYRRPIHYLKMFYVDSLTRIPDVEEQDIDVLFYGSFNERRSAVLDALVARGIRVEARFGVFGNELEHLISRSKVVINIHYYDNGRLELIRIFDLLANSRAVVSELNPEEMVDADLTGAFVAVPYEQLVEATIDLVRDPQKRRNLSTAAFQAFSQRRARDLLAKALAWSEEPRLPSEALIGSGKSFDPRMLNVDINEQWHPDIVADIADPELFEREFISRRFGPVRLQRGWFDSLTASHLLEHVSDLPTAMTNCLDLLCDGGIFRITVPYDLSHGAWQDPTHVRAFNEKSWLYYCEWSWYLGWVDSRFDLLEQSFGYSPLGTALAQQAVPEDQILRTARAVDEMTVVLRKRPLTMSEQAYGREIRGEKRGSTSTS